MFKAPFSFNGRIRRMEFGLSYLIYIGAIFLLNVVVDMAESPLLLIAILPVAWFFLAQSVKRSHDRGNSGWYILIPFYIFFMLFADSEYGANEYGENPKGNGNFSEFDNIGKDLVA